MSDAAAGYVMGHDDRERRRLALQASIQNPFTQQLFLRAGLASGMRVLDLGCGVGELSLMAARIVGPQGSVVAVDIDDAALETARRRAEEEQLLNIEFRREDIQTYNPDAPFDAVVGRHILIHTPDPLRLLRAVHAALKSDGVAVFHEFDFTVLPADDPELPLRSLAKRLFRDFFQRALGSADIGGRLFHLFCAAGFGHPQCRGEFSIEGAPDSSFYEWVAESLRSILPRAEGLGLVKAAEVDIDTFADRLRQETVSRRSGLPAPVIVECFARKW
jgi:ubiquinone/menaquinone biosynthesis C-methylase UbiE